MSEEKKRYILNNLVSHRLEAGQVKDAVQILTDDLFLANKYNIQSHRLGIFIGELYNVYTTSLREYNRETASRIVPSLLKLIIDRFANSDDNLKPEAIHALLVHRESSGLYNNMLNSISNEEFWANSQVDHDNKETFITMFQARLANVHRRQGDLTTAYNLNTECLKRLSMRRAQDKELLIELSRIEYDLAYIHFLRSEGKPALEAFDRSIEYAVKAGNKTSEWISRCVRSRCSFLLGFNTSEDFKNELNHAMIYFKSHADSDPNAERWIMNVNAHLLEVAFYHGDEEEAVRLFELLREDNWVKTIAPSDFLNPYKARIFVLQKKWQEAVETYSYLPQSKEILIKNLAEAVEKGGYNYYEGLAEKYLYYGKSLKEVGQVRRAKEVLEIGLACPSHYGNLPWQKQINVLVAELE